MEHRVRNDNSLLEHDQYNLLVRLINNALQDDNTVNSTNVAAKIVPLVTAFHRKLGPSVIQFAYTSVQEHSVWSNIHFWEEAFYNEAQKKIVELYANEQKKKQKTQQQQQQQSKTNQKVTDNETAKVANEVSNSPKIKSSDNAVPSEEVIPNDIIKTADPTPVGERYSPVVKRTVSETDAAKLLADKNLLNVSEKSHRGSLLITASTPLQRSRASTARSSSSTLVDETETRIQQKNSLKDLPDAMKLAADLVRLLLYI